MKAIKYSSFEAVPGRILPDQAKASLQLAIENSRLHQIGQTVLFGNNEGVNLIQDHEARFSASKRRFLRRKMRFPRRKRRSHAEKGGFHAESEHRHPPRPGFYAESEHQRPSSPGFNSISGGGSRPNAAPQVLGDGSTRVWHAEPNT